MEQLKGVVEKIVYLDEEKGFSIIKIKCKDNDDPITIVGNLISLNVGSVVLAHGNWVLNKKFGRQFSVVSWEEVLPATIYGIEKYLGSGLIRGVGPKFAKLIVSKFGYETLNVIENNPHRLLEIPNVGQKRVNLIFNAWKEHKDIKNLMIFLQGCNVSTALGYKIYKVYADKSISVIKKDPYSLIDNVYGIGFKIADSIACKLGIDRDSYSRCRAGIIYTLNIFLDRGHCYVPFEELINSSCEILNIQQSKITMTLDYLIQTRELIREEERVYLQYVYYCECGLCEKIKEIISFPIKSKIKNIDEVLDNLNVDYNDDQICAIKNSINSKFSIITGGPGVGKTTITKAIIEIFRQNRRKILLAAPTGRAAKRMSEVCQVEAKTIHRLLESSPNEGFKKTDSSKLIGDVLIIDEASMIDLMLMYHLIKAVPRNMRIILIGDVDQLPPIGAGSILKDIISSQIVPTTRLSHIYRQSKNSDIIVNAHRINNGEMPKLSCGFNSDFFFIEEQDSGKILELIVDLYCRRLPKKYKINPISDIQIITPVHRGDVGTDSINISIQSYINKSSVSLKRGQTEYKLHDKVMQIKNNYEKNVFNGDIGFISDIDIMEKKLTVNFDGRKVEYDILELDEISLSYCITVHKSQGGEFPIVIMPVTFKHFIMLQKNLLYTALTRAQQMVILIGQKSAIKHAIENNSLEKRYTYIYDRLLKLV